MLNEKTSTLAQLPAAQSAAMSDHLVRIGHLKAIQKAESWSDADLARHCGRSPSQVAGWFAGTRQIGERLARNLEERLGLLRYTLDDRTGIPQRDVASPSPAGRPASGEAITRKARELPILRWADVATMLSVDNAALKSKALHLDSFAASSNRAKFLAVPDDSMAPEMWPGDHVLFDPTEAPTAGDIVLVALPNGEHFIRVFRPSSAHIFHAVPVNTNFAPLSSATDQAAVMAVMIEHRRYRRPR